MIHVLAGAERNIKNAAEENNDCLGGHKPEEKEIGIGDALYHGKDTGGLIQTV